MIVMFLLLLLLAIAVFAFTFFLEKLFFHPNHEKTASSVRFLSFVEY